MISHKIPEVLALPERNRRERRRKAHACRAIVRSGYFRKHGVIANAAPCLQSCEAPTYGERLRDVAFVFAQRHNREPDITEFRKQCADVLRGRVA